MNRPEFALRGLSGLSGTLTLRPEASGDCRCVCGALLARWTAASLELKCRRCKTPMLIGWNALGQHDEDGTPQAHGACRCGSCGSLMARWMDAGAELKCRRCKRTPVLAWRSLRPLGGGGRQEG